jgi:hypothetical protein|tara:strand:- start:378 stop:647 length:270 start_codon:yes stop_codon:yes gene_type:complete
MEKRFHIKFSLGFGLRKNSRKELMYNYRFLPLDFVTIFFATVRFAGFFATVRFAGFFATVRFAGLSWASAIIFAFRFLVLAAFRADRLL